MGRVRIYMCLLSWMFADFFYGLQTFSMVNATCTGQERKESEFHTQNISIPCSLSLDVLFISNAAFSIFLLHAPHPLEGFEKILSKQGLWVTMKIPDLKNTWFPNDRSSAISISGQAVETAGSHGFWIPGAPSQRRSDTSAMLSGTQLPGHHPAHDSRTPHSLTQILSLTIVQKRHGLFPDSHSAHCFSLPTGWGIPQSQKNTVGLGSSYAKIVTLLKPQGMASLGLSLWHVQCQPGCPDSTSTLNVLNWNWLDWIKLLKNTATTITTLEGGCAVA